MFEFGLLAAAVAGGARWPAVDRRARGAFGPERWPTVVLSNHDQPRQASRYAKGPERDAVAKAAAVLLLTLRGTPFLYYGEEIGLGDIKVPRKEIVDPPARRYWPLPLWWNRDQCRAPMPWTGEPNGGFTTGRPWLRLAPDHATRNVARPGRPTRARSSRRIASCSPCAGRCSPLQVGSFRWVIRARDGVLAYRRDAPGEAVLVAINLGAEPVSVAFGDPATAALTLGAGLLDRSGGRWPAARSTASP